MTPLRHRGPNLLIASLVISLLFLYGVFEHTNGADRLSLIIHPDIPQAPEPAEPTKQVEAPPPPPPPPPPKHPLYKPEPEGGKKVVPIVDNFPLAQHAHSAADLPSLPVWSMPPREHVAEATPLFIGFTRNWRLIQQAVVSYVTAGWPAEDIYVVENTGTMDANKHGRLSLQNPFFLNHTRLDMLGVNVITTPTLLTFAQLQNFFLYTAIEKGYPAYFWSHMDVVALSYEDRNTEALDLEFENLYKLAVRTLRECNDPDYAVDEVTGKPGRWALRFFAYDRLALVNTKAYEEVGGWDTQVPFYMTDCDMHERLWMAGFKIENGEAGLVYDVGASLDDLEILYRKKGMEPSFTDPHTIHEQEEAKHHEGDVKQARSLQSIEETRTYTLESDRRNSKTFRRLMDTCDAMQRSKNEAKEGRNTWQSRQAGGKGEPYYRDPEGFEKAIRMWMQFGRDVYSEKWGHRECNLRGVGLSLGDAWRVEHDWDRPVPRGLDMS